jgi:hypothetical protein
MLADKGGQLFDIAVLQTVERGMNQIIAVTITGPSIVRILSRQPHDSYPQFVDGNFYEKGESSHGSVIFFPGRPGALPVSTMKSTIIKQEL